MTPSDTVTTPTTGTVTSVVQLPAVSIGTATARDVKPWLSRVEVDRAIRLVGRAEVTLETGDYRLIETGKFRLGDPLEIKLPTTSGQALVLVFVGVVDGINVDLDADGQPIVTVVAHDGARHMTRFDVSSATNVGSSSDVVKDILDEVKAKRRCGIVNKATTAKGIDGLHYLVSGRAIEVLESICDRNGDEWMTLGDGSLAVGPPENGKKHKAVLGGDILSMSIRLSSTAPQEIQVPTWDLATESTAYDAQSTQSAAPEKPPPLASDLKGERVGRRTTPSRPRVAAGTVDADTEALAHFTRAAEDEVIGEFELIGNPDIDLTDVLQLDSEQATKLSGDFVVSSVRHTFDQARGLRTQLRTGRRRPTGLIDLLGGPPPPALPRVMTGTIEAVDADGAQFGAQGPSVKVTLVVGDGQEPFTTGWCRVLVAGGGAEHGLIVAPEVGDEVVVAFVGAGHDEAVVLGGVLNGQQTFKESVTAPLSSEGPTAWYLRSKGGNELVLDDMEGKIHLRVGSGRGVDDTYTIAMGGEAGIVVTNATGPIKLESSGKDAVVVLDPTKGVSIESSSEIKLKASRKLTLEAGGAKLELGPGGIKAEGVNVELKAQAMAKLEAGAMAAVKGGAGVAIN